MSRATQKGMQRSTMLSMENNQRCPHAKMAPPEIIIEHLLKRIVTQIVQQQKQLSMARPNMPTDMCIIHQTAKNILIINVTIRLIATKNMVQIPLTQQRIQFASCVQTDIIAQATKANNVNHAPECQLVVLQNIQQMPQPRLGVCGTVTRVDTDSQEHL